MSSRFMTKDHLTGNVDLLIRWTAELKEGYREQLTALIEDFFERVSHADNINNAIAEDPFWQTVMEGTKNSSSFSRTVRDIMDEITPLRDRPLDSFPPGGTHSGGVA